MEVRPKDMPIYLFEHIDTKEIQEVFFGMKEDKTFNGLDGKETDKWKRILTCPNAHVATTIDPWSKADFIKKTRDKHESWGSMWDRSAELSAKRAERDGTDKVKETYLDGYEKRSKGVVHSERQKQKARETAKAANEDKGMRELGIKVKVNV